MHENYHCEKVWLIMVTPWTKENIWSKTAFLGNDAQTRRWLFKLFCSSRHIDCTDKWLTVLEQILKEKLTIFAFVEFHSVKFFSPIDLNPFLRPSSHNSSPFQRLSFQNLHMMTCQLTRAVMTVHLQSSQAASLGARDLCLFHQWHCQGAPSRLLHR